MIEKMPASLPTTNSKVILGHRICKFDATTMTVDYADDYTAGDGVSIKDSEGGFVSFLPWKAYFRQKVELGEAVDKGDQLLALNSGKAYKSGTNSAVSGLASITATMTTGDGAKIGMIRVEAD